MANEVSHRHSATGETLYFTIRNVSRQMWNTAGTPNFETLTVANWGDYDVALSESPASSYFYVGTFPGISGNMVAGWYWVDVFKRAGASPAISDVLQASYFGYWDGTTYKWWGDDTIAVGGTVQTAGDVPALINTLDDYVDTEIAAIKAKTDNLPTDPADESLLEAAIADLKTYVDTEVAAILAAVDTEVAAIKAKTDNLPTDPADESLLEAAIADLKTYVDTEVAAIKAKTDNLPTDPADESLLEAAIADLKTYVDTEVAAILAAVDTEVAAIKAKTDNLPIDPADQSLVEAAITSATSGLAAAITNIALIRKIKTNTVRDKSGSPGVYEVLDDDDSTPILEITISASDPYQTGTVL